MQVVYHLGAPSTDDNMLIKSLLKNRARLAPEGIVVPPPGRYRNFLRDTARELEGLPASPEMQDQLLDAIADEDHVERLVLSDPRFVCINRLVVQGHRIWPMIERRTRLLRNLFPGSETEFFIGMRDPATLIPALFRASRFSDFAEFTENMLPRDVRWSEMLGRLRRAHPDARITVWCNEDTPLIWDEIMSAMAGLPSPEGLEGREDLVQHIMEPAGFRRLTAYLAKHMIDNETQRRRIVAAFLGKYARAEAMEEELVAPGWTQEMLDEISEAYDADMERVAEIHEVDFITP
ncbi:hypothetical protein HKCCE3408_07005 [Rhodobacterales bacterium HKCCE3408]|nr:hypothetical protein [Rhodobacterales bacterium HKCCE3408]